jgi:photosystem II stability/assembly factor-like uncharacterized protein
MANLRNSVVFLSRLLSLLMVSSGAGFAAQWSEMNTGLANTDIYAVAIDPSNPAFVYAGSNGGVYSSTNGGVGWSNIGLTRVRSLAIDFTNPNILYSGTFGSGGPERALFKSTDQGRTWSDTRSPQSFDFSLLVMDPTAPKTLYAGSWWEAVGSGEVFLKKTVDGGETWIETFSPREIGVGCCTLAIDTSNPNIVYAPGDLYAGTHLIKSGVVKSTDGGFTWTPTALMNPVTVTDRAYGDFVNLLAIDFKNPEILYAATHSYGEFAGFTGLFKTSDGGNTWLPINTGLLNLRDPGRISAIVIDPDDTNVVYAATGGYGATDGRGVFKSVDGGKNWTAFNDGLSALDVRALALAPGGPNVLYVGTSAGVFKNIDDAPIVTLDSNTYCVGSRWKLTASNNAPQSSLHLLGTSNSKSWEIRDWRRTGGNGAWSETGVFAPGTEGTHYLRVEIDGRLSNVVSFVVANCRS